MRATDLHPKLWNAIANFVGKSTSTREIYFVSVTKVDAVRKIIYAEDFGNIGIPLVAHTSTFSYYDTQADGSVKKREDPDNPAFQTEIVCPSVGQLVIVLDLWGAKRFPVCLGVVQSKPGFWQEGGN